jgi:regulation of enolase protein 1 (concanavalin A-like superfamily)
MPVGGINYLTQASASGDPRVWISTNISAINLVAGTNVVAVEVHQKSGSSSDIAFNLQLTGTSTNGAPSGGGSGDTTPPASVTNLRVTTVGSNSLVLAWAAPGDDGNSGSAVSYDVRYSTAPITESNWASALQAPGEPVPASAGTSQTFTVGGLSSASTYYFALKTIDEANNVSPLSNVPVGSTIGLLAPWSNRDIGSVGVAGQASQSNSVFTVKGSGADIAGSADAFHFVYQAANGDCDIIARVTAVQNTSSSAKAGVMIRETLTANSRYAMMYFTPGNKLYFQKRSSTGGSTSVGSAISSSLPRWVRVTRTGGSFTAYYSSNGTSWTKVTSTSITMASNIYIGLAVTSRSTSTLNTSVFDNVNAVP